jgi:hypothetical protein
LGSAQNSIELNGQVYDVVTGTPLGKKTSPKLPALPVRSPKVIDGFMRRRASKPHNSPAAAKPVGRQPKTHTPRTVHHAAHRQTQKAKTLMRSAVKKPVPAERVSQTSAKIAQPHKARLSRAQHIAQSKHIKRFARPAHYQPVVAAAEQPLSVSLPKASSVPSVIAPKASPILSAKEAAIAKALRSAKTHESLKHTDKSSKRRLARHLGVSHKAVRLATLAFIVVLLGGFVAYQNIPNLSMRIASTRAGFSAHLPAYKPSGFALSGPIQYGPGSITVTFRSNSDSRNFALQQKVSNWNSQALVDNYMVANNKQYQSYEEKGKTIYVFDSTNATWVSGGVWYKIEGDSSLSTDQLLKIAASI